MPRKLPRLTMVRRCCGLLLVAAVTVGCGAQTTPLERTPADAELWGLSSCGAPDSPVGAFWGSDDGIGYPGDSEDAPPGGNIWFLDAAGNVSAATTDNKSRDPLLSRDGRRLYFTRAVPSPAIAEPLPGVQIWVRDLATGAETMLAEPGWVDDLAESPDGKTLAFVMGFPPAVGERPQRRLFTMDTAGGGVPEVVPWSEAGDPHDEQTSPSWSPDGSHIASILKSYSDDGLLQSSIRVIDPASGDDTTVYEAPEEVVLYDLAWLEDGDTMFVTKTLRGGMLPSTVIRVDRATGAETVVATGAGVSAVVTSAEGTTVADIGFPIDRVGEPDVAPMLTTWTDGELAEHELSRRFAFATDLTIAACALAE